jgi:23S rRNA (guanosine2251-2'-O)-methyltransferase
VDRKEKPEEKRIEQISQAQMKKHHGNKSGSSKGNGGQRDGKPFGKTGGGRPLAHPARARFQESRDKAKSKPGKRSGHEPARETSAPRRERHPDQSAPRLQVNLFGMHAVREAILNPAREIRAIYIAGLLEENIQSILDQAAAKGLQRPEPEIIEKSRLERVLPKGTVHQGIACDASPLDEVFLPDLVNRAALKERSVLVMLDQVTDPHNMGAILRSACAFGADGVIVQSRHAPELSGVVAKTASGAIEHLPVVYETNLSRTIESLKDAGYFVIALDERGEKTLPEAPLYDRTLLVLGAEGPGLRPLVRNHCDLLLRLPTQGGFTSLNVSNAAAIAMYAMISRRKT